MHQNLQIAHDKPGASIIIVIFNGKCSHRLSPHLRIFYHKIHKKIGAGSYAVLTAEDSTSFVASFRRNLSYCHPYHRQLAV